MIALGASCSVSNDADAVGIGAGGFSSDVQSSTTAGTGGGDASIDIAPDNSSAAPMMTNADLCGNGRCAPGAAPDGCAITVTTMSAGSGGAAPVTQACELALGPNGAVPVCGPVGPSGAGEPCKAVSDCGAGLGCVETLQGGVCRPYCCGDVEACPSLTYCAPRPMAENGVTQVPVCVPTDNCILLPNTQTCPLPQGPVVAPGCCGAGFACFIVRADGSTSCMNPGMGGLNGPCPCQAGFVCSKLTNECKKLCLLANNGSECPSGGKCEGGSSAYPTGYGVCVAGDQSAY